MSVKKFKFVSPGVFINEIDNSGVSAIPDAIGPVVIGRSEKGPALLPTTVDSFSEFVDVFGLPVGGGLGGDVWRNGNYTSPMYGTYAAQAWLKNNSPLTYVRLLGDEHPSSGGTAALGAAGWVAGGGTTTPSDLATNGGAFGMFIVPSASANVGGATANATGTLAAVFYFTGITGGPGGMVRLSGSVYDPGRLSGTFGPNLGTTGSLSTITRTIAGAPVYNSGANFEFTLEITGSGGTAETHTVNFNRNSKNYIRKVLNTNPILTNTDLVQGTGNAKQYWLGETFDKFLVDGETNKFTGAGDYWAELVDAIDTTGVAESDAFSITVPVAAGGEAGPVTHQLTFVADATAVDNLSNSNNWGVAIDVANTAALQAAAIVDAINGTANAAVGYGTAAVSSVLAAGTLGITAVLTVGETTKITLTMDSVGAAGNVENVLAAVTGFEVASDLLKITTFTGGEGAGGSNSISHPGYAGMASEGAKDCFAFIAALETGESSAANWGSKLTGMQKSSTGWIFSQNLGAYNAAFTPDPDGAYTVKLFKFSSHTGGEWNQNNIKISIQDIKPSKNNTTEYGTFSVVVRDIRDNDGAPRILERYSNVNLNPNSLDYIARRMGDRNYNWDDNTKRYIDKGDYANRSAYVYVQVHSDVANGSLDARYLPFGFVGPSRPIGFTFHSGSSFNNDVKAFRTLDRDAANNSYVIAKAHSKTAGTFAIPHMIDTFGGTTPLVPGSGSADSGFLTYMARDMTASIIFPTFALRSGSADPALASGKYAYYGFDSRRRQSSTATSTRFDESNIDIARMLSPDFDSTNSLATAFFFTLDDLISSDGSYVYRSGSYANSESVTATTGTFELLVDPRADATPSYPANRFTLPLVGGFDGFDITESDPFNNSRALSTANEVTNYAFYTIKKAMDTISDAEQVEVNVATISGITNESLTNHLINTCEERGDTLAVIDLKGGYTPLAEDGGALIDAGDYGSVKTTVDNMLNRGLNSSYGCAFYPWVQIRDAINDQIVWVPPSVVALGTFSSSERKSAPWFAPAGFTRGGLTEGAAGLPVLSVREKLSSEDRDSLYENNINPIASFPAEGIVIFGQKTLQLTQSALDRINVRRLLIYVKKEISRIAATTLFEMNVEQTWAGFTGRVNPFLEKVSAGGGLSAFKVILDDTTTTPDLVDRNIMYAKIFLKPAKAIEFIALDFIVTNAGASFED